MSTEYVETKNKSEKVSLESFQPDISMVDKGKSFENFMVSKCNQHAYVGALAVAENIGTLFNPMVISMASGSGKYHLICAMVNRMLKSNPELRIRMMSASQLTEEMVRFIRSCNRRDMTNFRKRFDELDCLILADLEIVLREKESTQEEVLELIKFMLSEENLRNREGIPGILKKPQIVLLCEDSKMKEIPVLKKGLRTYFKSYQLFDAEESDTSLKKSFIKKESDKLGLVVSKKAVKMIAKRFSDFNRIEGILKQCQLECYLKGKCKVKSKMILKLLEQHF